MIVHLTLHASRQEVGLVLSLSGIGRAPPGIVFEKQNKTMKFGHQYFNLYAYKYKYISRAKY